MKLFTGFKKRLRQRIMNHGISHITILEEFMKRKVIGIHL